MAKNRRTDNEWPRVKRNPEACYLTADGVLESNRPLVGPLRMGTAPGVGPRGRGDTGGASDFGTDNVTPRRFDPMGTSDEREPDFPASRLISERTRRAYRR